MQSGTSGLSIPQLAMGVVTNSKLDVHKAYQMHSQDSKVAKPPKPDPFLVWFHLSRSDLFHINSLRPHQQKDYICDLLTLRQHYHDRLDPYNKKRREVFLELCMSILTFCRNQKFSPAKTSTLFSIIHQTHFYCAEKPGSLITMEQGYAFFEKHLLRHSVERPPFSLAVFAFSDIKIICQYVVNSYFRHLKMYQYVFGITKHLKLSPSYSRALVVDRSVMSSLDSAVIYQPREPLQSSSDSLSLAHPVMASQTSSIQSAPEEKDTTVGDIAEGNTEDLTEEQKARLQTALQGELAKVKEDYALKLKQQDDAFMIRLKEIQEQRQPSGKKKKH